MMDRQRYILDFALASLSRRRGKTLSLVVVYSFIIFLLSSIIFLTGALRHEAMLLLQEGPDLTVQRNLLGRFDPIPRFYAAAISEMPGVATVRERLWGYYYDPLIRANYTLMVPPSSPPYPGNIFIGPAIASVWNASVGDTMSFNGVNGRVINYRVAKIFPRKSELVSADLVLMSAADFRTLSGLSKTRTTDLALTVKNAREIPTIMEKIRRRFPDTRCISRKDVLRTYDSLFNWRSGLLLAIAALSVAAFCIFAWDRATGLSEEERREMGVLRAIGWDTSDLLAMKFWEGSAVSLTSFLIGTILAYLHVFYASSFPFQPVLKGWATLYPSLRVLPAAKPVDLAVLLLLTVVPYIGASIVPCWRAATIDPDMAMR